MASPAVVQKIPVEDFGIDNGRPQRRDTITPSEPVLHALSQQDVQCSAREASTEQAWPLKRQIVNVMLKRTDGDDSPFVTFLVILPVPPVRIEPLRSECWSCGLDCSVSKRVPRPELSHQDTRTNFLLIPRTQFQIKLPFCLLTRSLPTIVTLKTVSLRHALHWKLGC